MKNTSVKTRLLSMALVFAMILSPLPQAAFSATTKTATHYILDTGVNFLWSNSSGAWVTNGGWSPGSTQRFDYGFSLPGGAKNVKVYNYDGGNFSFDKPGTHHWKMTSVASGRDDYNLNYYKYRATPVTLSHSYAESSGALKVNYTVTFPRDNAYDVKEKLEKGHKQTVYNLLGNPPPPEISSFIDETDGNFGAKVEGLLWFVPIIIQYDVAETTPDDTLEAILDLPKSAKVGDTYTARDVSEVGADLTVKLAELDVREVAVAARNPVATWPGRGKGQNSGGKKDEKAVKACQLEYRLTVTTTDGKKDTDTKKITIYEGEKPPIEEEEPKPDFDVSLDATLSLPPTVYEGHSVVASDRSAYVVDGKNYSPDAAYNAFGATHDFRPSAGSNARVETNYEGVYTDAKIIWPVAGEHDVTLRINLKGRSDTDTKPIEVLRTPAIIDALGGRQKENRKQTLSASIATNPNHPLKAAWMEVTEKSTGETVRLYPDEALVNTAHIKTRAMETKENSDEYFTHLEFPFLTKWSETREFSYTVYAEDARGQTASVTKDFTVVPDLPPIPEILLPTTFFREKGTNVARVEATDLSRSAEGDEGDRFERVWYASWLGTGAPAGGFADARTLPGYEELSFEKGKEIAFDKTGVGPVRVKLRLKDVWTDETLEEYVTDDDYLTAESAIGDSVVDNIAPAVSLSPKPTKSADLLLLAASAGEYANLLARKNELDGALIEKGIDAKISIKKLPRSTSGIYGDFQKTRNNTEGNHFIRNLFALDEDTLYAVSGSPQINAGAFCLAAPYCVTAYDAYSDAVKWSVRAPAELEAALVSARGYASTVSIGQDDAGKYLYLISDAGGVRKTFLFDKSTGAHAKTFDSALGRYNHIAGNNIYSLRKDGVYRYRTTGNPERVFSGEISGESARAGGKVRFFTQTPPHAYMAEFDPVTEKTTLIRLAGVAYAKNNACAGADESGAMLVHTPSAALFFDRAGRKVGSAAAGSFPIRNGEGRITHAAYAPNGDSWRQSLFVYDLYAGKSVSEEIQRTAEDRIWGGVLYGFDHGNGLVDVRIGKGSNDLGSGWGDSYRRQPGLDNICRVNMDAGTVAFTAHSTYMGYDDGRSEYALASDALYAVGWDLNSYSVPPPANDIKLKVSAIPRNEDQILAQTAASLMSGEAKDMKAAFVVEDGTSKWDANGSKFKAALGPAASLKLSDSGSASLAEAIAQTLADAGAAPQRTAVAQKAPGAARGGVERIFALDPQKTYYYEYEVSGADAKEGDILSMSTVGEKTAPDSDNLYVQKTYFENFDGGPLSGFFDIDGTSASAGDLKLAKTDIYARNDFTFTVPKGAYGVFSFDYKAYCTEGSKDYALLRFDETTLIDVRPGKARGDMGNIYNIPSAAAGHFVYKATVGEGTHVVSASARYDHNGRSSQSSYMILDNLKFEMLGSAPPPAEAWSAKAESIGGATRYAGSFNTPNPVISYSARDLRADSAGDCFVGGAKTYVANETYAGTKISFSFASERIKIKNFRLYYNEGGVRVYVAPDSLESASEAAKWQSVNASVAIVDEKPEEGEKEKGALVYKKGQLVAYNIGYADYENDSSKEGFWRYAHTPFNDGEHPDAAVIMSKKGEILQVADKVLPASIDRFYIDGKYVVEHWQRDDTDRTKAGNDAVDYAKFDKYSNTETLTFYIEGGGEAPWVTGVKTDPDPVKEGGGYKLEIGVDDLEKDDLTVIVEVYREGKEVYRYYEEDIKADENGDYPVVVTGLAPPAEVGDYTVVVTVFDKDGTGLGEHGFTVVTEGRIEGEVMHTELWDENRKRHNLKLFGEEVNRASAFAEYAMLTAPRPRGTNVFWSGERFMLRAGVAGDPLSVSCAIAGHPAYATGMTGTGRKNAAGEWIYEGSIWQSDMINKWGRTAPVLLTFVFSARYEGGVIKTHEARVIVDTHEDYRQLHRYY
ncbi:MAG: hypothetical protein LBP30_07725 [Clostridiales Family XIII bacterium]|jgi:hypothetical protein|nr:hypothetical protein [Clostridiales Family XIII bacterium]